jgi:Ca-activated chloride channel homolog
MFDHEKIKELFSAYLDQELSLDQQRQVEEHLEKCASCRREFNALHKLQNTLLLWKDQELSLDWEGKIKKILQEKKDGVASGAKSRKKFFAGSAALTVVIACLIAFYAGDYGKDLSQDKAAGAISGVHVLQRISETKAVSSTYSNQIGDNVAADLNINTNISSSMFSRQESFLDDSLREPLMSRQRIVYEPYSGSHEGGRFNTEDYGEIYENDFLRVIDNPLSTFSIDVDTASYSIIRRFINADQLPPPEAVRIEEMINYFDYDYKLPKREDPFSITSEIGPCPWNSGHDLLLIGLQGKEYAREYLPPSNYVFLIDVSGSMNAANKLPLAKRSMRFLIDSLRSQDRVAIVVYASASGVVLDSTPGAEKDKMIEALDWLRAGGPTAGGEGIERAYKIAEENFIKGGNNRVILATDGDFNVGVSSDAEMVRLIESQREKGIFLTVLGFGSGNYKDSKMEKIADAGNGNYYYIDNILEAKKIFVRQLSGTIFTIAKNVKIQIEFNPGKIKAYRLIGYENRMLKSEDFNDDAKDAGELGAGHAVTALYEIISFDSDENLPLIDDLKYQKITVRPSDEILTIKVRFRKPDSQVSELISQEVVEADRGREVSHNFVFAGAVAEFGLLLRDSRYKAEASYERVIRRAKNAKGSDTWGYRAEFIRLVESATLLKEIAINY